MSLKDIASKITGSEAYNKAVLKARELQEERQRAKGFKVAIVVERADGRRLLVNSYGVKGHVQVDDFDEERIKNFLGHPLGAIRQNLKSGKRYVDNKERVTFDFSAPPKAPVKLPKLPSLSMPKGRSNRSTIVTARRGYWSPTLGRWVNE